MAKQFVMYDLTCWDRKINIKEESRAWGNSEKI